MIFLKSAYTLGKPEESSELKFCFLLVFFSLLSLHLFSISGHFLKGGNWVQKHRLQLYVKKIPNFVVNVIFFYFSASFAHKSLSNFIVFV